MPKKTAQNFLNSNNLKYYKTIDGEGQCFTTWGV